MSTPPEAPHTRRRRGFDHLIEEVSLAVGRRIPRYPLWLRLRTDGFDPEHLDRASAVAFCGEPLEGFLRDFGVCLPARRLARVRKNVSRFDPAFPTPYERMAALGD